MLQSAAEICGTEVRPYNFQLLRQPRKSLEAIPSRYTIPKCFCCVWNQPELQTNRASVTQFIQARLATLTTTSQ